MPPDDAALARARALLYGAEGQVFASPKPKKSTRWSFTRALEKANARIADAAGVSPDSIDGDSTDPVQQAMSRARHAAPATMRLIQALTLGTDPDELDRRRGGVRIMAELAVRQLAIVGMKTGETVEHDVSERFTQAMALFFDKPGGETTAPRVIEHDPGEPARRLTEGG